MNYIRHSLLLIAILSLTACTAKSVTCESTYPAQKFDESVKVIGLKDFTGKNSEHTKECFKRMVAAEGFYKTVDLDETPKAKYDAVATGSFTARYSESEESETMFAGGQFHSFPIVYRAYDFSGSIDIKTSSGKVLYNDEGRISHNEAIGGADYFWQKHGFGIFGIDYQSLYRQLQNDSPPMAPEGIACSMGATLAQSILPTDYLITIELSNADSEGDFVKQGVDLAVINEWGQAVRCWNNALAINSENPDALYNLGVRHEVEGTIESLNKALDYYKKANAIATNKLWLVGIERAEKRLKIQQKYMQQLARLK
ncbi:MAG: tetratricopeptide repeat protein [Desulfovibrio sp.]